MATVNFIPCKKQNAFSMRNEIEYILQNFKVCIEPEKFNCDHTVNYQTYSGDADKTGCIRLISGKDCCPETAFQEFMATKNSYKKADQTMFYHYDQAFKDGETISPKTAHEIAIKFAEDNYPDFEVVIATHVDNEHLHSHFIINSVSFKTGKKLHQGPQTLLKLRAYSDHICQQYGLTTLEPYNGGKSKSLAAREYRAAAKGQSWKFSLMNTIDTAMKTSGTKAEFIKNMERQGYSIRWESSRKYITYTCPNTMSCRDIKLHDNRYLKEMMEREFELRRIEAAERRHAASRTDSPAAIAEQPVLLSDTGKAGQPVLQSRADLGWDRRFGEAAPCHTGTERVVTHPAKLSAHKVGAGANQQKPAADTADVVTGWETEREEFFSAEAATTAPDMDTVVDRHSPDLAGIGGSMVQLGRSLERLDNSVPINDTTTKPQQHTGRKKKLAIGQKEDDHSGHDFEMKM
ncbi:relaxase/mobilization nuclease domain-containing protein [Defluviitalea saccharophila]|uniref:Relaxase/mobilization nuclease domain-containing protein n=1 Tax=Defluviitalea saccharophila TaxID=879970 RepID=A0ABZ2Y247_9FIRM